MIREFLSFSSIVFAIITLTIVLIFSIVNWGQIGLKGEDGVVGEQGVRGSVGPENINTTVSCLETTNTISAISPSIFPKFFNNKNTVFFDVTLLARSVSNLSTAQSKFEVIVISDGVQRPFLNNNKLILSFQNLISATTIRATKGLVDNSLVLSTLQSDKYRNSSSTITNTDEFQLIALDVDFSRNIWLSFQRVGTENTRIYGRILTIPTKPN
jgi:hypothetical protein